MAVIFGTQGRDTIDGTDQDDLIRGWAQGSNPGTDLGDLLVGLGGNDTLDGGGGGDALVGGDGQDELNGYGGADRLAGETDNDELFGDEGDDTLLGASGDDKLFGEVGVDTLFGGEGDDLLSSGVGADRLLGGDGADRLSGDEGDDKLAGGDGRDRFEFSRNYDTDRILDFEDDVDTIVLDGTRLGVTSRADALSHATVVDGNTVFTFNTGDVLVVENIADPTLLRDDLAIV